MRGSGVPSAVLACWVALFAPVAIGSAQDLTSRTQSESANASTGLVMQEEGDPERARTQESEYEIAVEVTSTHEWPAKVDEVTAAAVEKMVNAPFFSDAVKRLPGADTLTGCPAGASLITIRGNVSNWTQVLLEGVPTNPLGRPYVLNFVPMNAVDSMRVLKGPAPPRYPGTTISGLVLLEMKTGDRYPGVSARTTVGGFGQRIYEAEVGGGKERRSHFLAFSHTEREGWDPHGHMDINQLAGKLVISPDDRSRVELVGSHFWGEKFGPKAEGPNPAKKCAAEWTDISQPKASLTYKRDLSAKSQLTLRISPYWFSGNQLWQQWCQDDFEPRFMPWEYQLLRAELEHDMKLDPTHIWTWGTSWQKDEYRFAGPLKIGYWDAIPGDMWKAYDQRTRSAYVQHSFGRSTGDTLTLGVRYDKANPGEGVLSPFMSWHRRINPRTSGRLAFTRNRRFPELVELYGQGMWIGNAELAPELGWTYQADLTWAFRASSLEVSLFQSELEDLIVADSDNVFNNIGEARLRGVEVVYKRDWGNGAWWANYAYLDAVDLQNERPLIVAFRTAYPKHSAKAGVMLEDGRGGEHVLEIFAYGPRRTDVDTPTYVGEPWNTTVLPRVPGFTWLNYKYTRALKHGKKLTISVENLLDTEAQDLVFYPRPGRWLNVSLSRQF